MPQITLVLMLVGALIVILGLLMDIKAHLKNHSKEDAPFRGYFGTEYERDLLRQSSWSDGESSSEPRTRFDAANVGDFGATKRRQEASSAIQPNRDRD